MSLAVGIDLGTTYSAISLVDEHGRPVVIPNRFGDPVTPSVVCFHDGEALVGQEAKEHQIAGHPEVAAFFKRHMGDPHFVFHAGGRDHSPVDLSALVLAALKRDAEQQLGEPVTHAVITVPAYFKNREREATIEAGRRAGLEVLQAINEPTAAAVAYGFGKTPKEQTLLVYDLGGGTFDVTLLSLGPDGIRVLASEGDHELGGKDWDDRIVEHLAGQFEAEHGCDPLGDLESAGDLLARAEEAKKRLSTTESAALSILHDGERGRYDLDRATFEELTADLMERTVTLCERVLEDRSLQPSDVDGVLLVGGSTRMPMVRDFVVRTFDREPLAGVHVDEAVALGAALTASTRIAERSSGTRPALRGAVKTVDVTNHSLGMIALDEDHTAYLNSLILPKNTPIPCTETRPYRFQTRLGGDNHLEIFMTQGESTSPVDVDYLGLYKLHDVPHGDGGVTVLDIEYRYDESGTVQVAGRVRATQQPLRLSVESLPPDVPERFLRPPEKVTEPVHVTAYLAFDLSGSMTGDPLREAQKAARSFLANVDLAHCSLGLVTFADRVAVKLRACQDARAVERAIDGLTIGELGIGNAADPFEEIRRLFSRVKGPRFVITLADGVWADQDRAIRRARACHAEGIESIAIGFGEADEAFLRRIASADEASFFTSMEGLVSTFTHIAQVITETGGAASAAGPAARPAAESTGGGRRSLLSLLAGR